MLRLWFKDGTYIDVVTTEFYWFEMDPEFDRVEILEEEPLRYENGHAVYH